MLRKLVGAALLAMSFVGTAGAVPVTDTVQAPTGFFAPGQAATFGSPYSAAQTEDWGWTHSAIGTPFTTATLNISAFVVDASDGELVAIYAFDNGVQTLLCYLSGGNII